MRSLHTKRIDRLEKELNSIGLRHLKFDESDIERYVKICEKFNKQFPGALSFGNVESSDIQEQGRCWAGNLASVLAYSVIQAELGNPLIQEFINAELPGFSEEPIREN